ncbi:MAG: single-stranded-DNA-specific exonuclease RecJ [Clostridia bacterium]|nr:single-stranded-DNA-specific exonuclease RecJ [Clostridia bacterium]
MLMLKKSKEPSKEKKWILHETDDERTRTDAARLGQELGVSPVLARLLCCRDYRDPEAARSFIRMESELLHNPFHMKDVEKAINRIRRAIRLHEKITIYGDYDVDGVTAVCTLYLYLKRRGADVDYYIPNRIGEGYGVSRIAIDNLAAAGTALIVTVDTGITAVSEIAYAKSLGIDVVVTDHHECQSKLPKADAVVNPHRPDCPYPFKELAGVGVVFKLICAYEESETGDRRSVCVRRMCEEYADLVAIGTIADVMPIRDENRLIVSFGLHRMESARRPGLLALMEAGAVRPDGRAEKSRDKRQQKITSGYIGYTLAPRINAAGRIRSAARAVELFLARDQKEAEPIARELCEANRERQEEENRIAEEAYRRIESDATLAGDPVLVIENDHWHHGVIGIVSSRITERYGLPSILVSFEGCDSDMHLDSDVGKGSGRSVKGMNLVDALVHCSDHLVKFGGHELAAGLSVTRGELSAFREKINEYAREHLSDEALIPTVEADCVLRCEDISMTLAEELRILEPYGTGNPVPAFVLRDARIFESVPISGGKHTRLVLGDGKHTFTAMCFSRSQAQMNLFIGDSVDVLFNLDINEYNGRRSVQLIVRDIRLCEQARRADLDERARFAEIWAGGSFTAEENILPAREDFAAVYNLVCRNVRAGCDTLSHRALLVKLQAAGKGDIGYIKLKIIIRVLQELNLMGIEEVGDENYCFAVHFSDKKTDLEKSTWLHRLRSQMQR